MDKATYLEAKRRRALAQEAATFKREKVCWRCHWIEERCWCPIIEPFHTRTRFVILMHPKEARKERVGTGRICKATLIDSEIHVGVDFTRHAEVNAILADPANDCRVLYPGSASLNISRDDVSPLERSRASGKTLVLFLIDGTWQCAKKMITLSLNIRSLPRISFTPARESIFEIKEQPAAYCLSTLESIHFYLDEADRRGLEPLPGRPHDNLITVFRAIIRFMQECALNPPRASYRTGPAGYSPRASRKKRKQKHGRGIILRD